jgi:hypothetical protein
MANRENKLKWASLKVQPYRSAGSMIYCHCSGTGAPFSFLRESLMLQAASLEDEKFLVREEKIKSATSSGVTFGWIVSLCSAEVS